MERAIKIEKGKNIAVIPARGGSKGVPHKNIRLIKGFPLIAYSIAACKLSKTVQRVIVSTDDETIAQIAKKFGAEVPFLRPKKYASDISGDIEFINHLIDWLTENEGSVPELLLHIRPTTPLREAKIIDEAMLCLDKDKEATSLRSAHKAPESPFKWFLKDEKGYFQSLITKIENDKLNEARQQFPMAYIPDGYIDILKTEHILETGLLHGDKIIAFESPMCIEVDTEDELELLEFQIEKKGSELYNYLNKL